MSGRIGPFLGCVIVGYECVVNGIQPETQHILSPDVAWLWYVIAFGWFAMGFRVLLEGVK